MASAASLLAEVEAAIEALLKGGAAQYSIGNRSLTKLSLSELQAMRLQLTKQAQRETGSGGISLGRLSRHRR